jgi:cell division protein FtsA
MDTRIGYPNEHLAGDSDEEFSSPLYATAVGLVMNGIENKKHKVVRMDEIASPKAAVYRALLPKVMREERKKRKKWKQRVKRIRKNLQTR